MVRRTGLRHRERGLLLDNKSNRQDVVNMLGPVIELAAWSGDFFIMHTKGAEWYWCLIAGPIPAAPCFFVGIFGLAIAVLRLGSYRKIRLP